MGVKIFTILAGLLLSIVAFAQQPQTSDVSATQPIYPINAKYVQGIGPGYWPTAGSGLTLNITAGTVWCTGTVRTYAGGTLTMTNSTTNYVYLDPASSCAPASSTSVFASSVIPIATVVAAGGVITTITDDRGVLAAFSTSSLSGSVSCTQMPALTGDVTTSAGSCATTHVNAPDGSTQAGKVVATNIAAPSSPSSGHDSLYTDSTDLRFHDKNSSGSIGTTVVADTGASNNFLTAISTAGAISKARPTCGNLSDSSGGCSMSTTAGGDLTGTLPSPTIANNAVTAAKMAVVDTRRTCAIIIGSDNAGSALANADLAPQGRQCFVPYAATVVEVEVAADGGTPNVVVAKNHAGSLSDLTSAALATASSGGIACSNSGGTTGFDGTTTCSGTLQNTSLAAGDYIETHSATAGGTAKRMSIFVTFTVN